jgi:DNA-binding transcriptional ArsR family regulator
MVNEKIISLDLNDSRMKHISEIFGSESCKKILNLLAEKEMTESEISKELQMPLNSVDYNVKKLVKAGLIESGNHWWSVKGKKMPSYRVADKKIIISPKRISSGVLLVPSLLVGGLISYGIKFFSNRQVHTPSKELVESVSMDLVGTASFEVAPMVAERVSSTGLYSSFAGWQWFLIGIWSGIILFFLLNYLFERKYSERGSKN